MLTNKEKLALRELAGVKREFQRNPDAPFIDGMGGFLVDAFTRPSNEGVMFLKDLCGSILKASSKDDGPEVETNAAETRLLLIHLAAEKPGIMTNLQSVVSNTNPIDESPVAKFNRILAGAVDAGSDDNLNKFVKDIIQEASKLQTESSHDGELSTKPRRGW